MLSKEARAELDRLFANRLAPDTPLAQRRREWEATSRLSILPRDARFAAATLDDVRCEWMEMPRSWKDRVIVLLHGGGYYSGSPRTHRKLAAELSRVSLMRVLMPDYRLAPESPFPAAVTDVLKVYGALLKQDVPAERIVLAGDSAGGGLVLSTLLALRDAGAHLPRAAVLLSPWTDLTCASPSYTRLRKFDPIWNREALKEAAALYAGKRDPREPLLSPVFADLTGLPPLLIHAGGDEVMLDDSRRLTQRALQAGVQVECRIYEGMWHAFHHSGQEIPESRQALDEIGNFVRGLFTR